MENNENRHFKRQHDKDLFIDFQWVLNHSRDIQYVYKTTTDMTIFAYYV